MIKIDENYFLTNDSNQWILNYEKEGDVSEKTGKPVISKDKWYCSGLNGVLQRYLKEAPKTATSIEELYALTNTAMERIIEVTKEV